MKPLAILISATLLMVILTVKDSISQTSDIPSETKTELSNSVGQNNLHLQNLRDKTQGGSKRLQDGFRSKKR